MRYVWPAGTELIGLGRPEFEITQAQSIDAALARYSADIVINAVAYTAVDRAESEVAEAFLVNARGPELLAIACRRCRVPLIHLSTDYVFDGSARMPYREDHPVAPINAYGRSKAAGETAVRAQQPEHVILRTAWVYGKTGRNFVGTMLDLACKRSTLQVVADQWGAPTAASDIATALSTIAARVVAARSNEGAFGTFHFAARGEASWYDVADHIFRAHERALGWRPVCEPVATAAYPTAARRPAYSVLDCSRVEGMYGVVRPLWQESLDRALGCLIGRSESDPHHLLAVKG